MAKKTVVVLGQNTNFYGQSVGTLSTLSHQVKGDVYIVDEKRIRIKNFVYDGQGPGNYFYTMFVLYCIVRVTIY